MFLFVLFSPSLVAVFPKANAKQTFSDYEDHEDLELELKQCEPEPDCALYSGAPLTSSSSIVLLLYRL